MKCYGACAPLITKMKVIHHVKEAPILLTLLARSLRYNFAKPQTQPDPQIYSPIKAGINQHRIIIMSLARFSLSPYKLDQ